MLKILWKLVQLWGPHAVHWVCFKAVGFTDCTFQPSGFYNLNISSPPIPLGGCLAFLITRLLSVFTYGTICGNVRRNKFTACPRGIGTYRLQDMFLQSHETDMLVWNWHNLWYLMLYWWLTYKTSDSYIMLHGVFWMEVVVPQKTIMLSNGLRWIFLYSWYMWFPLTSLMSKYKELSKKVASCYFDCENFFIY